MTVHLDWPPDVVDRLTKEARQQEAAARILEVQKRVKPDPEGWTSRDYINHGRR